MARETWMDHWASGSTLDFDTLLIVVEALREATGLAARTRVFGRPEPVPVPLAGEPGERVPHRVSDRVHFMMPSRDVDEDLHQAYLVPRDVDELAILDRGPYVDVLFRTRAVAGEFTVRLGNESEPALLMFDAATVDPWEPAYRFFASLGGALGIEPGPVTSIEDSDDEYVSGIAEAALACFEEALVMAELDLQTEVLTKSAPGVPGPFALTAEKAPDHVTLVARGGGIDVTLRIASRASRLPKADFAELMADIRSTLEPSVAEKRLWTRGRLPPVPAKDRGGKVMIDVYVGGSHVRAAELHEPPDQALREALVDGEVEVTRYFEDGTPFWKTVVEIEDPESMLSFEALFDSRTWQAGTAAALPLALPS